MPLLSALPTAVRWPRQVKAEITVAWTGGGGRRERYADEWHVNLILMAIWNNTDPVQFEGKGV